MIKIIVLQTEGYDYDTFTKDVYMEELAEQLYAQMMGWA